MMQIRNFAAVLLLLMGTQAAWAEPQLDPDLGTWVDHYGDGLGLMPAAAVLGGQPGRVNIKRDPIAQAVMLQDPAVSGSFFTTEIAPASISAWEAVYLDYAAGGPGAIQVEIWDLSGATAQRVLGPLPVGPSDDALYQGRVDISGLDVSHARLSVRVLIEGGTAAPTTLSKLALRFQPKSVLNASIAVQPAGVRNAGDGIDVRMPVSASYVSATDYVAYIQVVGVEDDAYQQAPVLAVEKSSFASFGEGTYTSDPTVVAGVQVPAHSVYWHLPKLGSGTTSAHLVTFKSNKGLVNGLKFKFQGGVHAGNAVPVQTAVTDVTMRSRPAFELGSRQRAGSMSGTFYYNGYHWAEAGAEITVSVHAQNWWPGVPSPGSQVVFKPVIWEEFGDLLAQGIADYADIVPLDNGQKTQSGTTVVVDGVSYAIPPNAVYWQREQLGLSVDEAFRYQVTVRDDAPQGVGAELCATLETPQAALPAGHPNACLENHCELSSRCMELRIGLDQSPGYSFSKGDELHGQLSLTAGLDNNPQRYVTWGDPIAFKMSVGNRALAHLSNVVVFDRVKDDWELVSASGSADARVWYYVGDAGAYDDSDESAPPVPPTFYASLEGAHPTVSADWAQNRPANPTWIAYEIPELRSAFCHAGHANGITNCLGDEPTAALLDLTVIPAASADVCDVLRVRNKAIAHFYTSKDLSGAVTHHLASPLSLWDLEWVNVRAAEPSLSRSQASGVASIEPGQSLTHTFTVRNATGHGNPIDTARHVEMVLSPPEVNVNGVLTRLEMYDNTASGATVMTDAVTGDIRVNWAAIPPGASRSFAIVYQVPKGIVAGTMLTSQAQVTAEEGCGPVEATLTTSTRVHAEPSLEVSKEVDYRVVGQGDAVTYALLYTNQGTAPSEETWVVDRVADGVILESAQILDGEIWFSDHVPPVHPSNPELGGLPASFDLNFPFSQDIIHAHFTPAAQDASGRAVAPAGAKWVAFRVDRALGVFPTGTADEAYLTVRVPNGAPTGSLVTNEALITAKGLQDAIGGRENFLIGPDPGVAAAKSCDAVLSNGETVTYSIVVRNNTTNTDDEVLIRDLLPENLAGHDFVVLDAWGHELDASRYVFDFDDEAGEATWVISEVGPGERVEVVITAVVQGAASGDRLSNEVLVTASNGTGAEYREESVYDKCTTLVQNTDMGAAKWVSHSQPLSGEEITYTLLITNHNQRAAEGVVTTDSLPPSVTVVGEPVVLSPGWQIHSGDLFGAGLVLQYGELEPGYFPGSTTPTTVRIAFTAQVDPNAGPGHYFENTVVVETTTGEECREDEILAGVADCEGMPNRGVVGAQTPWPDPWIQVSSQGSVKPGEITQWTVQYGNLNQEQARSVVAYFTMPEHPSVPGKAAMRLLSAQSQSSDAIPYYSDAPLGARPDFDPQDPSANGWSLTPSGADAHVAILMNHCEAVGGATCLDGSLDALAGPFGVTLFVEATDPTDGATVGLGATFLGCADIGMRDPALQDDDLSNNGFYPASEAPEGQPARCAPVVTPGLGLMTESVCEPDAGWPGAIPGAEVQATFAAVNNGTTAGYGVSVEVGLDARLDYLGDNLGEIVIVDAHGHEVSPVGADGQRLSAPVAWQRVVSSQEPYVATYWLGEPVAPGEEPVIGLAPGDRAEIVVQGQIQGSVADTTVLSHTAYGAVTPREARGDLPEIDLEDNASGCTMVAYRADVFVAKHMAAFEGECRCPEGSIVDETGTYCVSTRASAPGPLRPAPGGGDVRPLDIDRGVSPCMNIPLDDAWDASIEKVAADPGDRIRITIEYGNAGHYEASDVVMVDDLPEGLIFVAHSVQDTPPGTVVEYAGPDGAWGYTPTSPTDAGVTAIRVVYPEGVTMPAPASGVFSQSSASAFAEGHFENTRADAGSQGVVLGATPGDAPFSGSYFSPVIPREDGGAVSEWGILTVEASFDEAHAQAMSVDIFCGDTEGTPVATVELDEGTKVYQFDLRLLSPQLTAQSCPEIQLAARLSNDGDGGSCMEDIVPESMPFFGLPTGLSAGDRLIGVQRPLEDEDKGKLGSPLGRVWAWTWVEGMDEVYDLHLRLPRDTSHPETSFWAGSLASDLNDKDEIVGMGVFVPKLSRAQIPATCVHRGPAYLETAPFGEFSQRVDRIQWVAEAPKGALHGIGLHAGPSSHGQVLEDVTVYLGYRDGYTLTDDWGGNWTQGRTLFATAAEVIVGDDGRLLIEGQEAFEYDPARGLLLIELSFKTHSDLALRTMGSTWGGQAVVLGYDGGAPDVRQELISTIFDYEGLERQHEENHVLWIQGQDGQYEGHCLPYPEGAFVEPPEYRGVKFMMAQPYKPLIYINEESTIVASLGSAAFRGLPGFEPPRPLDIPGVDGVDMPIGRIAVWPKAGTGSGIDQWIPTLLRTRDADGVEAIPSEAVVTELGSDADQTIIGQTIIGFERVMHSGTGYYRYGSAAARAWVPQALPIGAETRWTEFDLQAAFLELMDEAGIEGTSIEGGDMPPTPYVYLEETLHLIPLEVDTDGSILGAVNVALFDNVWSRIERIHGLVRWTPVEGPYVEGRIYVAEAVHADIPTPFGDHAYLAVAAPIVTMEVAQQLSPDASLGERWGPIFEMVFSRTRAGGDGHTSYGAGPVMTDDFNTEILFVEAWRSGPSGAQKLEVPGAMLTWPSGAYGRTSLGFSAIVTGQGLGLLPWADFAEGLTFLGRPPQRFDSGGEIPMFSNANQTVVGMYNALDLDAQGEPTYSHEGDDGDGNPIYSDTPRRTGRVFRWKRCEGMAQPRLDAWAVTYHGTKNPSWSFEAEVDRSCRQRIRNEVEISTSTPEITLANNHSAADIVVNQADVRTSVSSSVGVVQLLDPITLSYEIRNEGPNRARGVQWGIQFPEGCGVDTASSELENPSNLEYFLLYDGLAQGEIELYIHEMAVGDRVVAHFTCYNGSDVAGDVLTAGSEVKTDSLDCGEDNNSAQARIIVGDYPNLWVGVEAPASVPAGEEATMVFSFGNNGNAASPAGAEVLIPLADGCDTRALEGSFEIAEEAAGLRLKARGPIDAGQSFTLACRASWEVCVEDGRRLSLETEIIPASGAIEADWADNQALAQVQLLPASGELQVEILTSQSSAQPGEEVLVTILVTNTGSQPVYEPQLDIQLPGGLVPLASVPGGLDLSQPQPVGALVGGQHVLMPGQVASVVVRARVSGEVGLVSARAGARGACDAFAEAQSPGPSEQPIVISVGASQPVTCATEGEVLWTVTAVNPSGQPASDVIEVQIPAGLAYVAGSATGEAEFVAPDRLRWPISLEAGQVLSLQFATQATALAEGIQVVEATGGGLPAYGEVLADCDGRLVLTKAWDLTCGVRGQRFEVVLTLTNGSRDIIEGALYDELLDGLVPDGVTAPLIREGLQLLPGASVEVRFPLAVDEALQGGVMLTNRASFVSERHGTFASNQVAGAIVSCGLGTACTDWTCEPTVGCVAIEAPGAPLEGSACELKHVNGCAVDGVFSCDLEGATICVPVAGAPEDGNAGTSYDGPLAGDACDAEGLGLCVVEGAWTCQADATLGCEPNEGVYLGRDDELCDDKDHDCDGDPTNGFPVGEGCIVEAQGICAVAGHYVCAEDGRGVVCVPNEGEVAEGRPEVCNGQDDDCDGVIDNLPGSDEAGSACTPLDTQVVCPVEGVSSETGIVFLFENEGVDPLNPDEAHADFECRLDEGEWEPCEGGEIAYEDLDEGEHVFEVRAVRQGDGAVDEDPARCVWTIDPRAIDTEIIDAPPTEVPVGDDLVIHYQDPTQPERDTFECRLDGGGWERCDGGSVTYAGLSPGEHCVEIRACDFSDPEAPYCDDSPVGHCWEVTLDGLRARGDGGCQGAPLGLMGAFLTLFGLALRRRRLR